MISRYIIDKDLKHYNDTFYHLKGLYSGLLSSKDLDETFNNAILINDKKHIEEKICVYTYFWIVTLIISLICLYFLSEWVQTSSTVFYQKAIETFKSSVN